MIKKVIYDKNVTDYNRKGFFPSQFPYYFLCNLQKISLVHYNLLILYFDI